MASQAFKLQIERVSPIPDVHRNEQLEHDNRQQAIIIAELQAALTSTSARLAAVRGVSADELARTTAANAVAGDSNALLDRVNDVLFAGRLSSSARAIIKAAVDAVAAVDTTTRARTALYLASAAPESQVLR